MKNQIDVSLDNGKYRVVMDGNSRLYALRNGEKWRDLVGDNLVYFLSLELQEKTKALDKANEDLREIRSLVNNQWRKS